MNAGAAVALAGATLGGTLTLVHLVRPRRSLGHWMLTAGISLLSVEAVCDGLASLAPSVAGMLHLERLRLLDLSLVPGVWLLFSLSYSRGNARLSLRRWLWPCLLMLAAAPLFTGVYFNQLVTAARWSESDGHFLITLGWPGLVLQVLLLMASVLVLMNLERTLRAAMGMMRWRIKFMMIGVGVLFVARIYTSSQSLLFRGFELPLENLDAGALIVGCLLMALSVGRSGAFEVDVYPSEPILTNSLTALTAGAYLVIVGVLAKVTVYVGGDRSFAAKAFGSLLVLVLLAVLAQSNRLRLRARQYVSRHFARPMYDYRSVWMKFTAASASKVEQVDLCRSLVRLVADMFQVLSVAIWVVDEKKEHLSLSASTFLSETNTADLDLSDLEGQDLMHHLQLQSEPVDLEASDAGWAVTLKRLHPGQFLHGGHRVCVPLVVRGELIGVITVGDRVGGIEFTLQDYDMLKCVGDHVTAALQGVQLSQKVLQAKELEAFQTMATFFVHDLKNAASTLNLMLQNLPEHYDDPAFREDSLKGISKTVTHINRLIGRLSLLRHEQKLDTVDTDLNALVNTAIAGIEQAFGPRLSKDLQPLPVLRVDREQFSKVVTNLVLNATEAVGANGTVLVETRVEGHWAVLTVSDDGCGMSPDFLSHGLFRPFQTTKKSGLGIGMFHSKMIVEAHGGRIAVASEQGEGTTFQVFLPVPVPTQ